MTFAPKRSAAAAAPRPTRIANPAAHSAGTGSRVRLIAMISAVAATTPTSVIISSRLLRRFAAAWA